MNLDTIYQLECCDTRELVVVSYHGFFLYADKQLDATLSQSYQF